jgi:N-methylhydantoinase B
MTFEVVKNGLSYLADEMAITVIRTAHSQVVRESMDFSTGLCDAKGRLIAQGLCVPMHLGAIPDAIEALIRKYEGNINPGDVFIMNDPDEGGMHLPDVFVFRPIFRWKRLLGFAACVAHYPDIGGRTAGGNAVDSTEIFQEGLQIPILKLYDRGARDRSLFEIIARNVRIPEVVMGDLNAQLAACNSGEAGMIALAERYGSERFEELVEEILDYTERRVRAEISTLPDGRYTFADYIDEDGFGNGPIKINVTLNISGDTLVADFAGTSPQVKSALNATMSYTKSAVYTALKCVMDEDILSNDGFFRPISVRAPDGTIANPLRPAPRAARGLTGFRMIDAVFGALHQAVPNRVPAAGEGGVTMIAFGGQLADRRPFVFVDFSGAGWGGRPDRDGVDGTSCIEGNLSNVPIEEIELNQPLRVVQYGFVPDTGGPGKWRGCVSIVREFQFLAEEGVMQIRSDRRKHMSYGLAGGLDGTPSWNILNPGTPEEQILPTHVTREVKRGDVLRHITGGGGGYGDPRERDRGLITRELHEGKFTPEFVRRHYNVVVDAERTGPGRLDRVRLLVQQEEGD